MAPPIIHATVQATIIAAVSNICAQIFDARRNEQPFVLHIAALLRFVIFSLVTAPPNYLWQEFLETTFPGRESHTAHADYALEAGHGRALSEVEKVKADDDAQKNTAKKSNLNWRFTFAKWFVDCITLGHIMNTLAFLVIMGFMKGYDADTIAYQVRRDFMPIIFAGYTIWPIASIVSFTLIPMEKRIVFLSFVGFCWGIYLSLIAAKT